MKIESTQSGMKLSAQNDFISDNTHLPKPVKQLSNTFTLAMAGLTSFMNYFIPSSFNGTANQNTSVKPSHVSEETHLCTHFYTGFVGMEVGVFTDW